MRTHLTNEQVLSCWGDARMMPAIFLHRRLQWLGHVARMPDDRIPKVLLFSLLPQHRPPGGPRKCWWDCVAADLKAVGAPAVWYPLGQSREDWRALFSSADVYPAVPHLCGGVFCRLCRREFSRPAGCARHKLIHECSLPVQHQR